MKLNKRYHSLRLVLGDQLNAQHSCFARNDSTVLYVFAERKQEANYVRHHIQKLCAFFLAMEHFADELIGAGHHVLHLNLEETQGYRDLNALILVLIECFEVSEFQYQPPDEYRLLRQFKSISLPAGLAREECDTEHFLLSFSELNVFVETAQHNRMGTFYRKMRKRFSILVEGDKSLGGKWNYDSENRQKLSFKALGKL